MPLELEIPDSASNILQASVLEVEADYAWSFSIGTYSVGDVDVADIACIEERRDEPAESLDDLLGDAGLDG